ncbi:methyltransferase-like protein 27 isoform X2 [Corythoichthys intestinalis]|uniref:methyltransferase-like protein 27 isoform X2 n=1 Tax=Corythoichthys intestinalis TaxID=161448 RepID=UPI0025A563C3|nr:methyltransferase-like protein 27 isoform X2 [Corythoichthys intestinalis]
MLSEGPRTFETAKDVILSAHNSTSRPDQIQFYDRWAQTYEQMKRDGFERFVGVDGSKGMLQHARDSGLYQDLKLAMLGDQTLPVPADEFDVVMIVGGLSASHVPVKVIRELWMAAKRGGLICMTTRSNHDNLEYKEALEGEMAEMEAEGLWHRIDVTHVTEWERGVTDQERGYIPGWVYVFQKL